MATQEEEFSNCELCPTGYGADSEGSESCVVCSSEQMTIDGSCQFCPKGTEVLSTFCVDCPQGKINNVSNIGCFWKKESHVCHVYKYFTKNDIYVVVTQ